MRCGVVVFPGSNCDHDVYHVLKHVLDQDVCFLWHAEENLKGCDLVVLPGGWSYGDYLRGGAMAALSPAMAAVRRHADNGGLVLGMEERVVDKGSLLHGAQLLWRSPVPQQRTGSYAGGAVSPLTVVASSPRRVNARKAGWADEQKQLVVK